MSSCERCLGLGWYAAPKEEGDFGDYQIRCEPCPATGNQSADKHKLFEVIDSSLPDRGLEGNLEAWHDAVATIDGLVGMFEGPRPGWDSEATYLVLVDAANRARVMVDYYQDQEDMRKVYAKHKANQ